MATLPSLPPRSPDSHKGDYGRALLIGGSRGMAGAIALAAMACLRSGAGLVRIAAPDNAVDTIAAFEPSYMVTPLLCDEVSGDFVASRTQGELEKRLDWATCVAVGPGLGRSPEKTKLVRWIYQTAKHPLVVDADALNALAENPRELETHIGPRVLTPHPVEFARLSGVQADSRNAQVAAARKLAKEQKIIVLLKGQHTFITSGSEDALNQTGNPGMATGGTGDVLTGIITALICQGLTPLDAAVLGAHVHGLAGDLAANELGQVSLIASDLVRFLPRAFQQVQN
ncbi:MAG: NAD(P)H-hydrate dehydratase [Pirellulaceae bacterium]